MTTRAKEDSKNLTAEEAGTWILEHTPTSFQRMMASNFSYGIERSEKQLAKNGEDPSKWSNPLEVAYVYCFCSSVI